MKAKVKQKLGEEEIQVFYNILCQYEMEENHNGYNITKIDKELKKKTNLNYKQKIVKHPATRNTINYKGDRVAGDLLRHVRNAFAHCNIRSTNKEFYFYDECRNVVTKDGRMDKAVFYQLIKEINKTKQP